MPRILVVDDERNIRDLLRLYLEKEGWAVMSAGDGEEGLQLHRRHDPDLVILDLMLPRLDGFEVCREIRRRGDTPILMLTARDDDVDSIVGLELGADDYVPKPFSPRELVARVRAVLRRGQSADERENPHLKAGDIEIDRHRFEVKMRGRAVDLTRKEFDLLAALVASPGRVFGREELLDLVWGRDGFVEPRTVDVHLARLRAKFIAANLPGLAIETVRGVGYRFRDGRD